MPIYLKQMLAEDSKEKPWVGFDLDCTLAEYDESTFPDIGKPIEPMINLVKAYLDDGTQVKIFTARAGDKDHEAKIEKWLKEEAKLPKLEITNKKNFYCIRYYDDRCVEVIPNKGILATVQVAETLKSMVGHLNKKIDSMKGLLDIALKFLPKKEKKLVRKAML